MTSGELRKKFLDFFEKRGHKIVPSSSLIPSDPSVLFTTAGMQQFKPYYLGEKSPYGNRVASCQKCFRTSDIDNIGDTSHLTFLEMLGHFSFGDYFKKETIEWTFEFLAKTLEVSVNRITVTVFSGDDKIPFDEESYEAWLRFLPETHIKKGSRKDNVWGPAGEEGPCGAANEIYIDGLEVATLVFMEYFCSKDGSLTPLLQKGVDVGWGLERVAMMAQDKKNIFETDLFSPIVDKIPGGGDEATASSSPSLFLQKSSVNEKAKRIIADHIKSAVFLISEEILPSNVERGYVLRRILRRAIRYGKLLNLVKQFLIPLAKIVAEIYKDIYPELKSKETDILTVIQDEEEKFEKTLEQGLREFEKNTDPFILFTTYGFPIELTQELAKERGKEIDMEKFNDDFKKHQELSRTASSGMFKGGLADAGKQAVRYHTATHLLLVSLRQVLGNHVFQKGSNINTERLRFDFSHTQKMTEDEIKRVEYLVNEKIKEDLEVVCEEMPLEKAKEEGAMGVFENKYGEKVKVYSIAGFSKEICGGPHVKSTAELGHFKIIKEEASSAGVRRIRAILK